MIDLIYSNTICDNINPKTITPLLENTQVLLLQMTTSENHDWLLPQNEQGDRGNLPGRHLRHFNSRSFFKQNSAQTFAKWIKPAVKLLFCLRRQHRRRTPSSFWSVKKHPESLRMVI
jgi:hypothetical protein